ncbi:hypothetical protein glysoja_009313 [Glycine soja]|nr:hypothetical protein glysoja_009313 [Glycine soja]
MLLSLQSNLPKQRRNEEALYILCYTNISRRYKMNLMVKEKKQKRKIVIFVFFTNKSNY